MGLKTFTVTLTDEELIRLNSAWKKEEGCMNRSDYVRKAINAYSGVKIFD